MECVALESQILTCQQLRRVPPPIPASLPPSWVLQGLSGQSYPLATVLERRQTSLGGVWPGFDTAAPLTGCVTWGKTPSLSEPSFSHVEKMDGFYVWSPVETHFLRDLGCLV